MVFCHFYNNVLVLGNVCLSLLTPTPISLFFWSSPFFFDMWRMQRLPPKQNIIVWSWLWMLSLWVWPVGVQNSVSWNLVFILEFLCGGHSSLACVVWVHHSAEDASPNPAHLYLQSLMVQAPCSHPFCNCPLLIVLLFVLYTTWNSHRLIHGLQITRL